jgi:hypothetical protein
MNITFDCPFCRHPFTVPEAYAGKKAKCKHCGTSLQIPGTPPATAASTPAAAAPKPAPKPAAAPKPATVAAPKPAPKPATVATPKPAPKPQPLEAKPAEIYGLDDDDVVARPSPAGSIYEEELEAADQPPVVRRAGSGSGKSKPKRSKASSAGPSENTLQARKIGWGLMGLGVLSFVLPMVGLQIKGLHRLGPEQQAAFGIGFVVLGAAVVGLTYLFGTSGVLKRLAIGVGAIAGGFFLLTVLVAVFRGPRAGAPGPAMAGMPNLAAAFPGGPAAGAPAGVDTRPPWEREPSSTIRVALSNGKLMNRTIAAGVQTSGVDIEVDYQVTSGALTPGETLTLVIQSKSGRGELDNLFEMNFQPSGTIGASSFTGSPQDGPYTAWLEVGHMGGGPRGGPRKKVSDDISLNFVNAPAPVANPGGLPTGMPGMPSGFPGPPGGLPGPTPGLPGPPPGFPGPPPGFPGARP